MPRFCDTDEATPADDTEFNAVIVLAAAVAAAPIALRGLASKTLPSLRPGASFEAIDPDEPVLLVPLTLGASGTPLGSRMPNRPE